MDERRRDIMISFLVPVAALAFGTWQHDWFSGCFMFSLLMFAYVLYEGK